VGLLRGGTASQRSAPEREENRPVGQAAQLATAAVVAAAAAAAT
jgi:hypothetical protein